MNNDNDDQMLPGEHDEATCEGLHVRASFSIRAFGISKGSLDLLAWYQGTFKAQYPKLAEWITIDKTTSPETGEDVIEVMNSDFYFTIDSLLSLYMTTSSAKSPLALPIGRNSNPDLQ